jgi:hypothetical protein
MSLSPPFDLINTGKADGKVASKLAAGFGPLKALSKEQSWLSSERPLDMTSPYLCRKGKTQSMIGPCYWLLSSDRCGGTNGG